MYDHIHTEAEMHVEFARLAAHGALAMLLGFLALAFCPRHCLPTQVGRLREIDRRMRAARRRIRLIVLRDQLRDECEAWLATLPNRRRRV